MGKISCIISPMNRITLKPKKKKKISLVHNSPALVSALVCLFVFVLSFIRLRLLYRLLSVIIFRDVHHISADDIFPKARTNET